MSMKNSSRPLSTHESFRLRSMLGFPAAFGVGLLFLSCGGAPPPPAEPPPPSLEPAAEMPAEPPPAAEVPGEEPAKPKFDDLAHDKKIEFMKNVVLPKMTQVFVEADAKYEKMNCVTCHGEGAKAGKFEMPNPKLPKLDPTDSFAKHMKKSPKVTEFMMQRVVPTMADLLGEEPYNPETQKGFGCFKCHTQDGK